MRIGRVTWSECAGGVVRTTAPPSHEQICVRTAPSLDVRHVGVTILVFPTPTLRFPTRIGMFGMTALSRLFSRLPSITGFDAFVLVCLIAMTLAALSLR